VPEPVMSGFDPLGELVDAAYEVVSSSSTTAVRTLAVSAGPYPIVLRSTSSELLTALAAGFIASPTTADAPTALPQLEISIVSAAEVDARLIPPALRPAPDETVISRDQSRLAVATALHRTLWIFDPERASATLWIQDPDDMPVWELATPLLLPLSWWASEHSGALIHTAAVADINSAVLLVGASGAGKSTTSLACLDNGLDVIGDDYCLIEEPASDPASAWVHQIYRFAKLDDHSLGLLPQLADRIAGPGPRHKYLIDLAQQQVDPKPIRAICEVVQRDGATTHLLSLSPARALRAVAPQSITQQPLWQHPVWQLLANTVRTIPCYQLVVGSPSQAPEVLAELLAHE